MTTEEQVTPTPAGDNTPKAKVFVGNLSFRTRSKGLREAFEKVGPVEGARVVTQGRRSMGFGFVQFASLEDAQKAVAELHHSDLDERKINVEISTSLNTNLKPPNKRKPRKPRSPKPAGDAPPANGSPVEVRPKDGVPVDAPPKGNSRNSRKPQNRTRKPKSDSPQSPAPSSDSPTPTGDAAANPRTSRPRKKRPAKPREGGAPPRERPVREFSNTVLYVSNLPFSLEDEGLKAEFAEFSPISANVIRRNRNNLSKGFGFVEFADEAQQQAALDAKHKSTIGDREITVRKAHIRPPPEATPANPAAQDATPAAEPEAKAE